MTEHDKRWDRITQQLNREYKLEWVKLVVCILIIGASIGLTYLIWSSNLPPWLKIWLVE